MPHKISPEFIPGGHKTNRKDTKVTVAFREPTNGLPKLLASPFDNPAADEGTCLLNVDWVTNPLFQRMPTDVLLVHTRQSVHPS